MLHPDLEYALDVAFRAGVGVDLNQVLSSPDLQKTVAERRKNVLQDKKEALFAHGAGYLLNFSADELEVWHEDGFLKEFGAVEDYPGYSEELPLDERILLQALIEELGRMLFREAETFLPRTLKIAAHAFRCFPERRPEILKQVARKLRSLTSGLDCSDDIPAWYLDISEQTLNRSLPRQVGRRRIDPNCVTFAQYLYSWANLAGCEVHLTLPIISVSDYVERQVNRLIHRSELLFDEEQDDLVIRVAPEFWTELLTDTVIPPDRLHGAVVIRWEGGGWYQLDVLQGIVEPLSKRISAELSEIVGSLSRLSRYTPGATCVVTNDEELSSLEMKDNLGNVNLLWLKAHLKEPERISSGNIFTIVSPDICLWWLALLDADPRTEEGSLRRACHDPTRYREALTRYEERFQMEFTEELGKLFRLCAHFADLSGDTEQRWIEEDGEQELRALCKAFAHFLEAFQANLGPVIYLDDHKESKNTHPFFQLGNSNFLLGVAVLSHAGIELNRPKVEDTLTLISGDYFRFLHTLSAPIRTGERDRGSEFAFEILREMPYRTEYLEKVRITTLEQIVRSYHGEEEKEGEEQADPEEQMAREEHTAHPEAGRKSRRTREAEATRVECPVEAPLLVLEWSEVTHHTSSPTEDGAIAIDSTVS